MSTKTLPKPSRIDELAKPKRYGGVTSPRVSATKKFLSGGGQNKLRKSYGNVMQKKKIQKMFGVTNPEYSTNTSAQTTVPRALLLTPSSSDNSLITTSTSSGAVSYLVSPRKPQQPQQHSKPEPGQSKSSVLPYLLMQRQNTVAQLKFATRKSVSTMDFKEARRTGNYQIGSSQSPKRVPSDLANKALVPVPMPTMHDAKDATMGLQETKLMQSLYHGDVCYFMGQEQPDTRLASLRIFNTIMLHAWRRRREEVRRLSECIEEFKRGSVKNKNQLHVYNSLFKVEQRRNEHLNEQLQRSYVDNSNSKTKLDEMTEKLQHLKNENVSLQSQIKEKTVKIDEIHSMLEKTNTKLFQAIAKQRELLMELTRQQRMVQQLENEKSEAAEALEQLKLKFAEKEDSLRAILNAKTDELESSLAILREHDAMFDTYRKKQHDMEQLMVEDEHLKQQLTNLQSEVITLEQCLAATLGNRLKHCFRQSIDCQKATYHMLHWVAYYMLPAAPPPRVTTALPPVSLAVKRVKAFFNANFQRN